MKYRTVPFARGARRTVSPIIPRGPTMNGLAPLSWGKLGPRSGVGAYAADQPGGGFLGASQTVIMRADPTKSPGFPGLFQWLAEAQPAVFNYVKTTLPPHLISATKVLRTGGATLGFMGDDDSDEFDAISSATGPDLSTPTFDTSSVAAPSSVAIDTGESTSSPTPSPAQASQIIAAVAQAGQAIVTGVNAQTVFNTQLARAQAGLPPLNTSAYGLTGSGITSALTSPMGLIALGGGILLLVMMSKKG